MSSKGSSDYDLYQVSRGTLNDVFANPIALEALNTPGDERAPWRSPDGARLYFHRPGSVGATDLFVAQRNAQGEFVSATLVAGVNSPSQDEDPYLLEDEATLFFTSSRGSSTNLWTATGTFSQAQELANVNDPTFADTRPVVRRDGLMLYFNSQRSGVGGDHDGDIWIAQRPMASGAFQSPQNAASLNTTGIDFPVSLSADGCSLYVGSNRETGSGSTPSFRLYRAQRQPSPSQVTVSVNIVGAGSVGPPYSCTSNGTTMSGTCSVQRTFGNSLVVEASRAATWTGLCRPNGTGTLSSDGIVPFGIDGTCTVTFAP